MILMRYQLDHLLDMSNIYVQITELGTRQQHTTRSIWLQNPICQWALPPGPSHSDDLCDFVLLRSNGKIMSIFRRRANHESGVRKRWCIWCKLLLQIEAISGQSAQRPNKLWLPIARARRYTVTAVSGPATKVNQERYVAFVNGITATTQ